MTDLIARLESAPEGSRELDAEIARAIGWVEGYRDESGVTMWRTPGNSFCDAPPCWSESIDVALTLVQEGIHWEVRGVPTDEGFNHSAQVNWEPCGRTYAETPALALCIAALKAREAAG